MIFRKLITFWGRKIGGCLIQLSILCFFNNVILTQETNLQVSDLRRLGKKFQNDNQLFTSYIYNLSFYYLTTDSNEKLAAGIDALDACIVAKRLSEGEMIIGRLLVDFPEYKNFLNYQYGYLLMLNRSINLAISRLEYLPKIPELSNRVKFMKAYAEVNFNNPEAGLKYLSQIEVDKFPYQDDLREVESNLSAEPAGKKKHKAVAVPLSIVLPGAGQLYSGFYFDALQSFGFNLILGYSAFASWRYELGLERKDRTYVLPILSSIVSGLFYVSNIFNSANSADKANLYRLNRQYSTILKQFELVLKDDTYFLNVNMKF